MKLQGLKYHLLVLIFICAVSAGCVQTTSGISTSPVYNSEFSADYYLLKRPVSSDYRKLDEYSRSEDPYVSASASLILGFYHLRDNNVEKAKPLITENYNRPALDSYMASLGELWMMELAIKEADYEEAGMWAASIKDKERQSGTEKALNAYCSVTRRYPAPGKTSFDCVSSRLKEFGVDIEASDDDRLATPEDRFPDMPLSVAEEYSGPLQILVTGGGNMFDRAGGMYYFLRMKSLDHKIRISKEYIVGNWDFWLDMDSGILRGKGMSVNFMPDTEESVRNLPLYVDLDGCTNVVLGVTAKQRPTANDVLAPLKEDKNKFATLVEISGNNVARGVRSSVQTILEDRFCAIAVGTEKEVNNFVPAARQYVTRRTQNIYFFVDANTGGTYASNYKQYYLNSYMFTEIDIDISDESKEFSEAYLKFTGKDATIDTVIGYDMLNFIHKMSKDAESDSQAAPYVTNIKSFSGGRAVRDMKAFHITSSGKIVPLEVHIDYGIGTP